MIPSIDIYEYCTPEAIRLGQELFQARGVRRLSVRELPDGTSRIEAKVMDSYNFVCRPWMTLGKNQPGILLSGCSCALRGCEHLAALMLAAPELQLSAGPVPEPIPEPIPEPEPIPVPIPEPEPIPVPEPELIPELPPRSMEIRFGDTLSGEEPIIWYPNDTERVFHTNVGIIGTMGTGKTQFTKSMVTQIYRSMGDNYDGSPLG